MVIRRCRGIVAVVAWALLLAACSADVVADMDSLIDSLPTGTPDLDALLRLGTADDPRLAWLFSDLLRFVAVTTPLGIGAADAWIANTGVPVDIDQKIWATTTNHLLAWDTPAPPGYQEWKGRIFELIEPGWAPFFADEDADIDWRWLSWGGVRLDDPPVVQANTDDDWLADDRLVFAVEVHEMINMTIGGRRVGIPYCTLCGSAQAYLTDDVPSGINLGEAETFELRTSGLLSRSNKVMFELHTNSVFDTFTGVALSGPLQDAGVALKQVSVVVTTWGGMEGRSPGVVRTGIRRTLLSPRPASRPRRRGPNFPHRRRRPSARRSDAGSRRHHRRWHTDRL